MQIDDVLAVFRRFWDKIQPFEIILVKFLVRLT